MSKDPKSEQSHRSRIEQHALKVQQLYESVLLEFATIARGLKSERKDKIFSFDDYPQAKKKLQEILENYANNLSLAIEKGTTDEWYQASKKRDTRLPMTDVFNARNKEALKLFQNRVESGMNLSDRVWKIAQQSKEEIELALSGGILEGKSAAEIARGVKAQLKEPDKLFRRVRDEFGILQLSKKAKAYSPGQGVYRSSYKNALRLTRTEINMAYRASDHYRWSNDRSVIGFEIKLSNRHVIRDICDDLKGKYPKGFLFRGWHPQCLCYKVPILMNDDDFDKLQQAILEDKELPESFVPSNQINDLPKGFKEWAKSNAEKSKNWKSTPYFLKDNYNNGKIADGLKDGVVKPKKQSLDLPIEKEKFKLNPESIQRLQSQRSIVFNGKPENFNAIMEGFNIDEFDDEITKMFGDKGINFSEKIFNLNKGKVSFSYSGAGVYLERSFFIKDDVKNVNHDYFKIPENIQGGGISKQLFQSLYKQYQNAGIEVLNVHANINVGGYTWAKYGFGTKNNSFAYKRAKEKLTDDELVDFEKLWSVSGEKKNFLNKLSNTSFGKKVLLYSDWYGSIDLRKSRERNLFEKYLFGK